MNYKNQNNKNINTKSKYSKSSEIYRNNSELVNKNSYMIYELNNTFKDKNKDKLNINESDKSNNFNNKK